MAYKGREYAGGAAGVKAVGDVIVPSITVRPKGEIISVFVKLSAGALTSLALYESIDGVDWRNETPLAAYQGSSDWAVFSYRGVANFPAGTLLQLRCITAGVTVEKVLVVQDW